MRREAGRSRGFENLENLERVEGFSELLQEFRLVAGESLRGAREASAEEVRAMQQRRIALQARFAAVHQAAVRVGILTGENREQERDSLFNFVRDRASRSGGHSDARGEQQERRTESVAQIKESQEWTERLLALDAANERLVRVGRSHGQIRDAWAKPGVTVARSKLFNLLKRSREYDPRDERRFKEEYFNHECEESRGRAEALVRVEEAAAAKDQEGASREGGIDAASPTGEVSLEIRPVPRVGGGERSGKPQWGLEYITPLGEEFVAAARAYAGNPDPNPGSLNLRSDCALARAVGGLSSETVKGLGFANRGALLKSMAGFLKKNPDALGVSEESADSLPESDLGDVEDFMGERFATLREEEIEQKFYSGRGMRVCVEVNGAIETDWEIVGVRRDARGLHVRVARNGDIVNGSAREITFQDLQAFNQRAMETREPRPASAPRPEPAPVLEPVPASEPVPVPAPASEPAIPEPAPAPAPESDLVPAPEPAPASGPGAAGTVPPAGPDAAPASAPEPGPVADAEGERLRTLTDALTSMRETYAKNPSPENKTAYESALRNYNEAMVGKEGFDASAREQILRANFIGERLEIERIQDEEKLKNRTLIGRGSDLVLRGLRIYNEWTWKEDWGKKLAVIATLAGPGVAAAIAGACLGAGVVPSGALVGWMGTKMAIGTGAMALKLKDKKETKAKTKYENADEERVAIATRESASERADALLGRLDALQEESWNNADKRTREQTNRTRWAIVEAAGYTTAFGIAGYEAVHHGRDVAEYVGDWLHEQFPETTEVLHKTAQSVLGVMANAWESTREGLGAGAAKGLNVLSGFLHHDAVPLKPAVPAGSLSPDVPPPLTAVPAHGAAEAAGPAAATHSPSAASEVGVPRPAVAAPAVAGVAGAPSVAEASPAGAAPIPSEGAIHGVVPEVPHAPTYVPVKSEIVPTPDGTVTLVRPGGTPSVEGLRMNPDGSFTPESAERIRALGGTIHTETVVEPGSKSLTVGEFLESDDQSKLVRHGRWYGNDTPMYRDKNGHLMGADKNELGMDITSHSEDRVVYSVNRMREGGSYMHDVHGKMHSASVNPKEHLRAYIFLQDEQTGTGRAIELPVSDEGEVIIEGKYRQLFGPDGHPRKGLLLQIDEVKEPKKPGGPTVIRSLATDVGRGEPLKSVEIPVETKHVVNTVSFMAESPVVGRPGTPPSVGESLSDAHAAEFDRAVGEELGRLDREDLAVRVAAEESPVLGRPGGTPSPVGESVPDVREAELVRAAEDELRNLDEDDLAARVAAEGSGLTPDISPADVAPTNPDDIMKTGMDDIRGNVPAAEVQENSTVSLSGDESGVRFQSGALDDLDGETYSDGGVAGNAENLSVRDEGVVLRDGGEESDRIMRSGLDTALFPPDNGIGKTPIEKLADEGLAGSYRDYTSSGKSAPEVPISGFDLAPSSPESLSVEFGGGMTHLQYLPKSEGETLRDMFGAYADRFLAEIGATTTEETRNRFVEALYSQVNSGGGNINDKLSVGQEVNFHFSDEVPKQVFDQIQFSENFPNRVLQDGINKQVFPSAENADVSLEDAGNPEILNALSLGISPETTKILGGGLVVGGFLKRFTGKEGRAGVRFAEDIQRNLARKLSRADRMRMATLSAEDVLRGAVGGRGVRRWQTKLAEVYRDVTRNDLPNPRPRETIGEFILRVVGDMAVATAESNASPSVSRRARRARGGVDSVNAKKTAQRMRPRRPRTSVRARRAA